MTRMTGEIRGYVGMVGLCLAVLGAFLPFVDWGVGEAGLSIYTASVNQDAKFISYIFFGLAAAAFLMYLFCKNIAGCVFSVLALLYDLLITVAILQVAVEKGASGAGMLSVAGSGFWLMIVGLVIAVLSPAFNSLNDKLP